MSTVEDQWDGDDMTLDLHLETRQGKLQLFGIFDFRVVSGIMRFEKPTPAPKSQKVESSIKKRKRDEDIDMDNLPVYDPYNGGGSDTTYTEKVFFLNATDQPTAWRPTWRYRWRGIETGECEIQCESDLAVNTMTFRKNGDEISGTFRCDFIGECTFTGVKIRSRPSDSNVDPANVWSEHDENAYETARISRW
jgi:hypothetical protein